MVGGTDGVWGWFALACVMICFAGFYAFGMRLVLWFIVDYSLGVCCGGLVVNSVEHFILLCCIGFLIF